MAAFLVRMPGWRPADYWALTRAEHEAIAAAYVRANRTA